jgi:hypothetical protein
MPAFGALDRRLQQPEFQFCQTEVLVPSQAIVENERVLSLVLKRGNEYPGLCPVYTAFLYHSWNALQVLIQYWDHETQQPWRQCLHQTYIHTYGFANKPTMPNGRVCGTAFTHHHQTWGPPNVEATNEITLLELELRRPRTDIRFVRFLHEHSEEKESLSAASAALLSSRAKDGENNHHRRSPPLLEDFGALIQLKTEVLERFCDSLRSSPQATLLLQIATSLDDDDRSAPATTRNPRLPSDVVENILDYLLEPRDLSDPRFSEQGCFGINPMILSEWKLMIELLGA